jgi:hypothetical protein
MPKSTRLRLPLRLCPSPRPSPRASLAGRGRSPRWQCQDAPLERSDKADGLSYSYGRSILKGWSVAVGLQAW